MQAWEKMISHVTSNDPAGVLFMEQWIRRLILREPERLPYLRLWGATDESALVQALGFVTNTMSADGCLQQNSKFNGELEHARVAVIKHVPVSSPWVVERLDDWMHSVITIKRRYEKPRTIPNTIRWIELARAETKVPWPVISFEIKPLGSLPTAKQLRALQDDAKEFRERICR